MPLLKDLVGLAKDYGPSIAGPVAGGLIARNAVGDATRNLTQGADQAMLQNQPYADVGKQAVAKIPNFGMAELEQDPGFRFRLAEGQKLLARKQASSGSLNSGAAWKAMQQYTQDQASQEFGQAWNRNRSLIDVGQRANDQNIDLITARAQALASGDIAKANALTQMISGAQKGIEGVNDIKQLGGMLGGLGKTAGVGATGIMGAGGAGLLGTAGGTIGPGLAGTAAANSASLGGLLSSGAAGIGAPLAGPTGAAAIAPTVASEAAAGGGFLGGLGSAATALATNPITWALGAGILGAVAWSKSQAHHEADTWVQGNQKPFDLKMANIDLAVMAGQMTPEQAKIAKAENAKAYLSELNKFAEGGSDERQVRDNAMRTFQQWYGDPAQYGVGV